MKIKKIKVLTTVLIVAGAAFAFIYFRQKVTVSSANEVSSNEVQHTVARGDITISVSESGTVNPVDKRSVKSEIDGTVDTVYVTEGDSVKANQVLISLKSDTSDDVSTKLNDINLNIEKLQRELNELYENRENLNIYSPISGILSDVKIETGDNINSGSSIATIKDTDNSYIEVYFTKEQYENISVGDTASVFMPKSFETCEGSITEKNSTPVQMGGGIFGYLVTVKIRNPGGFSVGDLAQVSISNLQGTYQAIENGTIIDVMEKDVTSKVSGKIKSVDAKKGLYIKNGDIIAAIESSDIEFEIAVKLDHQQQKTCSTGITLLGKTYL
jgi:HlyD family secretion protein